MAGEPMTKDEVEDLLQPIHAMEQRSGQMIGRKALHMFLPQDMDYKAKRYVIKAWQDSYFSRFKNVMNYASRKSMIDSVTGK